MGADIKYNRDRSTFYYTNGFDLRLDFHVSFVNGNNEKNIYGGNSNKISYSAILFH